MPPVDVVVLAKSPQPCSTPDSESPVRNEVAFRKFASLRLAGSAMSSFHSSGTDDVLRKRVDDGRILMLTLPSAPPS